MRMREMLIWLEKTGSCNGDDDDDDDCGIPSIDSIFDHIDDGADYVMMMGGDFEDGHAR